MERLQSLALAASVIMPLWNIPLIVKIVQRRSAEDLSVPWMLGVWVCMLLMLPWAVVSPDIVLKVFSIVNFVLFSGVVIVGLKYRKGCAHG
ncbi:MAG: hypothetical protein HQL17_00630 [Candidatus Omnitrophica bacterium]|nr:hypothetical protein [Candidatus Omnitrophota bacterium]